MFGPMRGKVSRRLQDFDGESAKPVLVTPGAGTVDGFPDNSSQDNSSRTTRRGQFVAKYQKIYFIESTASTSATLFSSLPLPYQLHFSSLPLPFQLHFFITPDSTSETFLSLIPLPFLQHYFRHFRFHFRYTFFITPASTSAIFFSSTPLSFHKHSFHQSRVLFSNT